MTTISAECVTNNYLQANKSNLGEQTEKKKFFMHKFTYSSRYLCPGICLKQVAL